jgi:hypothetical protein
MGSQVYRETYLAALEVAHSDLDRIIGEFDNLQLRKEQLEDVLGALEPFLRSAKSVSYEPRQAEHIQPEPVMAKPEPEIAQPILRAVPVPEPVTPAAFSPIPEPILDPIQNRINRALGLAVA